MLEEERDKGFIASNGSMVEQPGEREDGPTLIDVSDKQISIGEVPVAVPQEEILQEQVSEQEHEQAQQEPKISKRKQKRRITSYLSNISKQVEKNGNQISKMTFMVQSLQKQRQSKSIKGTGVGQSSSQLIKQIQSQVSQLQKQVTRIQNDIHRTRITSGSRTTTRAQFKKLVASGADIKPKSKKGKSLKGTKIKRGRKNRVH